MANAARVMKRPRVLLADEHQMVADALKSVLEPHCEESASEGGIHLAARSHYSGRCHATSEWAGRRPMKHSVPKAKLIFLTMNEDPQLVGEAFRAGASAFLLKQAAASELTDAVEIVLKGSSYVTPRAAKGQANIFLRGPQASEGTS